MRRVSLNRASPVLALVLVLAGCGGGGGGGQPADLQYVGNSNPAVITAANATRLLGYVIAGAELSDVIPTGVIVETVGGPLPGVLQLTRRLDRQFAPSLVGGAHQQTALLAGVTVNETEPCFPTGSATPSGSIRITGTLDDDDATGTLTIIFNDCQDGDTFLDGAVIWRIDTTFFSADDFTPVDMTFTFQVLTLVSPEFDIQIGGSLREQFDFTATTSTFDIVYRDRVTGRMQKTEDLVIVSELQQFPLFSSDTITGRFYDSVDGYVAIETLAPLIYGSIDAIYPTSGLLRLTGAASARLRATILSSDRVSIALDLNNDGSFEIEGEIPFEVIALAGSDPDDLDGDGLPDAWEAQYGLSNLTFADASIDTDGDGLTNYEEFLLGTDPTNEDADGDGMPDGWEISFGFDPLDAADAALDFDGDLASNLDEFMHGTDPTDAFSTPADLAVSMTVSLETVSAQTLYEYRITVSNLGPGRARGLVLSHALPPGAAYYSAIPGSLPAAWDCDYAGDVLTCVPVPGDSLNPGVLATITVPVVAPAPVAVAANSAAVTSTTLDFAPANDAAALEVEVLPAVLSQVDVAVDDVAGVEGMERPFRLALSPDGGHVYVPAVVDDAVVVFARDQTTGQLTWVETERNGLDTPDQPDNPTAVAVSPDGHHVYVVTNWVDGAIVVYGRDEVTGALTFIERHDGGAGGVSGLASAWAVTVSHDGGNVYVAGPGDDAIAVFERDGGTGALTFMGAVVDGEGGVDGIAGVFDVMLSPDDVFLYVAGAFDNAIAIFSRGGGGELSYLGKLDAFSPLSLAISSDGQFLYAVGGGDIVNQGISAYARDVVSGELTHLATWVDGEDGVVSLGGVNHLAIAPDGAYVYVAAQQDSALGVFVRDAGSGLLRFIEVHKDGIGGSSGLGVAWAVAVSPDSRFVHVSASSDDAVSVFSVDPDG